MKNQLIAFLAIIFIFCISQAQDPGFFLEDWESKTAIVPEFTSAGKPTETATSTINIDIDDRINKVPKYVYGNNAITWAGKLHENPTLVNNIQNLYPHVLRWPGGNLSNEYFWNRSSDERPEDIPSDMNPRYGVNDNNWELSTDEYYELLELTNCTGIICVNYSYARYGTSDDPVTNAAHLAAEWVRYDNGRSKFWEIGNENYGTWQAGYQIDVSQNKDGQPEYISGELYGKHCGVFIDSMKAAAAEIGVEIYIGVVTFETENSYDNIQTEWNEGMMPEIGDKADFLVVHSYFTPYEENSTISTILNSHDVPEEIMEAVSTDMAEAELPMIPLALTEWNIFAVGSMQQVSYINGMLASLVLGELIKNDYGLGTRWDLANGWGSGDDHGMFSVGGEPGVVQFNPRPVFYYMYYFQKYFGDYMVNSSVDGNSDLISFASSFSSGECGIVLINKSTSEETALIEIENFEPGNNYYYHTLVGGKDNDDFSRMVFVNGEGPSGEGGGPDNYETIKAYASEIDGGIKVNVPPLSVIYLLIDKKSAPEYIYSKVDTNSQIISIEFSDPILIPDSPRGFEIKVNNANNINITNVEYGSHDSTLLLLSLDQEITKNDAITIAYTDGNLVSIDNLEAISFSDTIVDNLLPGSIPRLLSISTDSSGKQLSIEFNKTLIISDTSINYFELILIADTNKILEISNLEVSNKILIITPIEPFYSENSMVLSYSGNDIHSIDSGFIYTFDSIDLVNVAPGLPPEIISASVSNYGLEIELIFDKEMNDISEYIDSLSLKVNTEIISINEVTTEGYNIIIVPDENIRFGDLVTLSYYGSNITSTDRGVLERFTDENILNELEEPVLFMVPGMIEAELFSINIGMQTETCTDNNGGENLGYIDAGDWLEYEINVTESGEYTLLMRIAAASIVGQVTIQTPDGLIVNQDTLSIPVTGGWQSWMTIYTTVNLEAGQQRLRLVAVSNGYNINWLKFEQGNTIPVASISGASTSISGDAIEITFDKALADPISAEPSEFIVDVDGNEINVNSISTKSGDGSTLVLTLEANISLEDNDITVSYSGNSLIALDNSLIESFEDLPVDNLVTKICNDISIDKGLYVYPNPLKNRLTFVCNEYGFDYFEIVDLVGRILDSGQIMSYTNQPYTLN
ncbi:carbohydrate-binding protein, partial [Bacteroidota bacterium]